MVGGVLDLHPQAADVHHDGVVVDDAVIPDIAVNLLFGENPVCVGHKIFHEESLFAGQGDLLPVFVELHLVADVPEHAGGEDGGAGGLGCDVTEVEDYVKIVSYSSGSEMSSAMAGGHIHISISGVDEIKGLIDSGDIVPLISLSEERMSSYPDIECTGEKGIDSYIGTWRGIFCRTDTPAAAVAAMDEAIKKAWESEDYQEFLKNANYLDREGYQTGDDFQTLIDEEYVTFEEYLKGAGLM